MKKMITMSLLALMGLIGLASCKASIRYNYGYHRGYYCDSWNDWDCDGGYRSGWRWGWHSGHHRHGRWWDGGDQVETMAGKADPTAVLAKEYGIRPSSAQKILALAGDTSERGAVLKKLDLDRNDLKALSDLQMPSRASVNKVADALGEQPGKIEKLLTDFIRDARADKKAEK